MSNDELTPDQVDEIRRSMTSPSVPDDLEERVIEAMKNEGLVAARRTSRRGSSSWLQVAAAAVIAVISFSIGTQIERPATTANAPTAPHDSTYMLLLRESPESAPESSEDTARLVEEYRAWAHEKAAEGKLVGGEKLDVGGRVLRPGAAATEDWTAGQGFVGGYFLVTASDYDEAARIARSCPHLEYGGTIEIRKIDS